MVRLFPTSCLYTTLWNLKCSIALVLPLSCYRKKIQNLSHLSCVIQIRQLWIQLITALYRKYCKRRCKKHASLIWSYRRRHLMDEWLPQWRHGPAWPRPISQSLFQFAQISGEYLVCLFLQYFPNAVINCIQIWLISGSQLRWGSFGVFFMTTQW